MVSERVRKRGLFEVRQQQSIFQSHQDRLHVCEGRHTDQDQGQLGLWISQELTYPYSVRRLPWSFG